MNVFHFSLLCLKFELKSTGNAISIRCIYFFLHERFGCVLQLSRENSNVFVLLYLKIVSICTQYILHYVPFSILNSAIEFRERKKQLMNYFLHYICEIFNRILALYYFYTYAVNKNIAKLL